MQIEQSLAARKIAQMIAQGWQKQACINAAAKLVQSQGFGAAHSKKTAEEMYELVA